MSAPFRKSSLPPPSTHRLRIIGGTLRGRVLRFPPGPGLRPTPDRVRETLFNWLGRDLSGMRCLDLYAGSGALTFEALSRGAALAVAVDRSRAVVEHLLATAATFRVMGLEAHCADAMRHLAVETRSFDVIFLDPPFAQRPWDSLFAACALRAAAHGYIYAEADHVLDPPQGWRVHRHDKAGQVHYHLLARAEPGAQDT